MATELQDLSKRLRGLEHWVKILFAMQSEGKYRKLSEAINCIIIEMKNCPAPTNVSGEAYDRVAIEFIEAVERTGREIQMYLEDAAAIAPPPP